jgi:hypothetical protein
MNIWNVGFWALLVTCFMACVSVVITRDNWFFVIGMVSTTVFATYFLGEQD